MTVINRSIIVPYSAEEMFALVDRVEDYPQFLPWCKESTILSRDEDECRATLLLEKGGLQKSFTTHNRLQHGKMIEIRLVDGPFRQLEGFWKFESLESKLCRVTLDLEFEFSNKFLEIAFGSVFQQITHHLIDAFGKRAEEVYVS